MSSDERGDQASFAAHDHRRCRDDAIARAENVCRAKGLRLTPIRRRALELLWESHTPVGAYELIARLEAEGARVHPPTIYRALEFLTSNGLAHKIQGSSAFVGCARPEEPHSPHFMICTRCGEMREFVDPELDQVITRAVRRAAFDARRVTLEIEGVCPRCATVEFPGKS